MDEREIHKKAAKSDWASMNLGPRAIIIMGVSANVCTVFVGEKR